MKVLFISFVVGLGVGVLYGLVRVKSPAPPIVALLGLLGMHTCFPVHAPPSTTTPA
jgi:XapX domain-containing protein